MYWNPNMVNETIESDGVRRKLDPTISLAHELYHSFDSIRGILDFGRVNGPNHEFETVMEYRAVYFENLVRKGFGVKLRKHYGDGTPLEGQDPLNPPDLLDETGETIYIPSPCLNTSVSPVSTSPHSEEIKKSSQEHLPELQVLLRLDV